MRASFRSNITLHGVVYAHRISDIRVGGLAKEDFHVFRKICGNDGLKNVVIMTTMWRNVSEEVGNTRAQELAELDGFFKPALAKGARLVHHRDDTVDSARAIIRSILDNHPRPLEIQAEMVQGEKSIGQTAAGQEIDRRIAAIVAEYEGRLKEQYEAADRALKERDAETREEVLEVANTLRDQIKMLEEERARSADDYKRIQQRLEESEGQWRCNVM